MGSQLQFIIIIAYDLNLLNFLLTWLELVVRYARLSYTEFYVRSHMKTYAFCNNNIACLALLAQYFRILSILIAYATLDFRSFALNSGEM